jgi:hypothetical protein
MYYNGACKELRTRGKYEVGKTMEKDKASYLSELEKVNSRSMNHLDQKVLSSRIWIQEL